MELAIEREERLRALIVEDDEDVARLVRYALDSAGFDAIAVGSVRAASERIGSERPDVVVLDLMLPDRSGTDLCRQLRHDPRTVGVPIIMLTARGSEFDRVAGLEAGADDYVVKPFSVREVVLRVQALTRRAREPWGLATPAAPMRTGDLELDPRTHEVSRRGEPVELRPLEYRLLAVLMGSPGRVFSRADLLVAVWGSPAELEPRTVDAHIRRLRIALGADASMIETVQGFGYRAARDKGGH